MSKHFELTKESHQHYAVVKRIRALVDMPMHSVKAGDLGGFVYNEDNLSDQAWVAGDAVIAGPEVRVYDTARIMGEAHLWDNVRVSGNARINGKITLRDNTSVTGNATLEGSIFAYDNTSFSGYSYTTGMGGGLFDLEFSGKNIIEGDAYLNGYGHIVNSKILGGAFRGNVDLRDAELSNTKHLIRVDHVGSENRTAILYRKTGGSHRVVVGCWNGTLDELPAAVNDRDLNYWNVHLSHDKAFHEVWRGQYLMVEGLFRACLHGWEVLDKSDFQ